MDNYETEEQQVEAIKKWWQENYKMVVFLGLAGLTAIVGVQQWKQNKVISGQTASAEYDHVLSTVRDETGAPIKHQVDTLLNEYSDYPYAALAVMLEAKQLIAADKPGRAEEKYQWVIANAKAKNLQHISRVRLASLMASQGKNEQALELLNVDEGSFKASYLEVKGDILVTLKRIEEARSAYDQALQAYAAIGSNSQILKIKRNDLGNS